MSPFPSNGDRDVIRGGAALQGVSEGNPAERGELAAGLQLQPRDITWKAGERLGINHGS